jgi:putative ATP-dependent endonuclease of OLD family
VVLFSTCGAFADSTKVVNLSIRKMGSHNFPHNIKFGLKNDIRSLTKTLDLISEINSKTIPSFGGDGRNNQIYLSMWCDESDNKKKDNDSTVFYFIEEPETHLHPTFQLSTMNFLIETIKDQLVVTTHSPSIAASFLPENIVRLYFDNQGRTHVSNNGCSDVIATAIYNLGYRLNVINSEIYFARGVILVEGTSERILYEELSRQLKINLNSENIIIVSVGGVGFKVYNEILEILKIPFVMRTDLDIFKKPKINEYYSAGINRIADVIDNSVINFEKYKKYYFNIAKKVPPNVNQYFINKCRKKLSELGYFLSFKDLETDLADSEIFEDLKVYLFLQKNID